MVSVLEASNFFSLPHNHKKTEKDLVTNYYLSSMILYGQNHYTCLFYNKIIDKWSFVDDNNKKKIKKKNMLR